MTILHVDTDPGWRGGQQLLLRLACGLVADGVPTQVACPRGGRLHRELVARKIDVLGIPAGASLRTIPQLRRAAPRLLVAHTSHAHGLCAMSGLPVVVHRWVDAPLSATPWSRWKYARPVRFVACSHAVKGVLEAGGVESDRICVVHGECFTASVPALWGRLCFPIRVLRVSRCVVHVWTGVMRGIIGWPS